MQHLLVLFMLFTFIHNPQPEKGWGIFYLYVYLHTLKEEIMLKKSCLLLVILIVSLLASCSADTKTDANHSGKKTISIGWPLDIGPLNPHTYLPNQMTAQAMVYESLVEYNDDGTISPKLAEKWKVSDDQTTYTFYLREGVKYSDGSIFNADNVIRNFNAILENRKAHSWMGMVKHIDYVKKIDDYTVALKLDEPYYPVLNELAFVRPFRFLGDAGFPKNDATSKGIKTAVGTGPWALKEYKKDKYAIFKRNDNYWGEKPKVDEVKIKIIPDSESIALAFENQELDLIYGRGIVSLDNYTYLKDSGNYETAISEPLSTQALLFNTQSGPLQQLKVRQAIHYAINKQSLVSTVTHGTEKVADTLFWDAIPYADIDLKALKFDSKKAKSLLNEAGWKLENGQTIRTKDGQKLELDLTYIATDAIQKPMAEMIQGELAKVGIKLNIKGTDVMVGLHQLMNDETDINFWRTNGPPTDPHNFINESATPNASGVYEAKRGLAEAKDLNKKVQQVLVSTDEATRSQLYKEILTTMHDEALFYPISYETNNVIYQKSMQKLVPRASEYDIPYTIMDFKK
ncbi:nickel ABC transporter substrate-binding protein [Priestia megaterium]|uniref:nickel ABC transporter substrate-binding protein n=1 Tax=Priestia megaterium TaxID=1404 RepID=UPI00211D5291|nr:nickel ABC transporter substrate-binding protein [Priestia megaterium]